ncbi:P-selectin-like isoform X2 [Varanus komodoensis]|uniref:P-selectin-like isoform X2 n=1 Tax=Varanus komodoensis TaxID=61221 RepID=UPI001CF7CFEF|nr:P-selectin-like isoform X2 [Varanus komodoensis]
MVVTGRGQARWKEGHFVLCAVLSLGLVPPVGAWTYHYGDQSELTWWQARKYCQEWFTDLVAIQNQGEIAYLNEFLPFHRTYYWIGIRKINNTWTWVGTQKPLTKEAENWAAREPNNRGANQDCVEIYIKRQKEAGKWNDERCTRLKRALCYNASCQPFPCNERSECVETIGSYTCQCLPGFFGPECQSVVKCGALHAAFAPLLLNCSHPLAEFGYRSSCSFQCREGFERRGPASSQCLPSGLWTAEPPQCTAVQCRQLNIPAHGDIRCSHLYGEFQYRSECNFRCAAGFLIRGAESTVCDASGEWSSPEPTCQVKQCQEIETPTRGTMDCVTPMGNFAYNATCDFACEPGFQLNGSKTLRCDAVGQWTSQVPSCDAVPCPSLEAPPHGGSACTHPLGEFRYRSSCTFHCTEGFLLLGGEEAQCTASGEWTAPVPVCQAISCPKLSAPENGELNCLHPYGDFAYSSRCNFSCHAGFLRVGTEQLQCLAEGRWTEKPPFCKAKRCPSLQNPTNGRMACTHPLGEFAYQSTCEAVCEPGFISAGAAVARCLATGDWSTPSSACSAVICPALHKPDHGRFSCLHPHGNFAYGSSCNFSCSGGFQLAGPERLECTARGDWTKKQPRCEAVRCPALEDPAHGRSACSHPYGHFAYRSSCVFSCRSGFELLGPEMLNCTDQGNWTGAAPTCEATRCPGLLAPLNGHMNCTHPHGDFSFDSGCSFSCDVGFSRVGPEMLQCTPLGEWTKTVPTCEAMKCLQLKQGENMKLRCSSPWAPFSYGSACEFSCPEGYVLNGTKQMQCQADGSWSAAMPLCQENVASSLTQVLRYTGGVAASVIGLVVLGTLMVLAIKRLSKRERKKQLLSQTSDLGAPGVFTNAAYDSFS